MNSTPSAGGSVALSAWSQIAGNRNRIECTQRVRRPSKTLIAELIDRSASVLDIGAGNRVLLRHLTLRSFRGAYVSVDVDPHVEVDYRSLEEVPGRFDVVTMLELLEHLCLEQGLTYLARVRRLLKPGGLLIISTPDPSHPTWFLEDIGHVQHWPIRDLAAIVHLYGYQHIRVWKVLDFALPAYPYLISLVTGYLGFLTRNILSRLLAVNLESRTYVLVCNTPEE